MGIMAPRLRLKTTGLEVLVGGEWHVPVVRTIGMVRLIFDETPKLQP